MPRHPKTPQQKKRLGLAKDRRNVFAENNKSSRKNIPLSRAKGNRRYRKSLRRSLSTDPADFGVSEPAAAARVRKRGWRKIAEVPLGEHLQRQTARRAARADRKKRR